MALPTQIGLSTSASPPAAPIPLRFIAWLLAIGLIGALIVSFFFIHLPDEQAPTLSLVVLRSILFVLIGALAGTVGPWFFWRRGTSPLLIHSPIPRRQFLLCCALGWVWVPAVVLLSREDSPLTAFVAILGAALLGYALRRALPADLPIPSTPRQTPFAGTLPTPPRQLHGYAIAICIYIAGFDLYTGWILSACALLAGSAFLIAWKSALPARRSARVSTQVHRAARRLALVLIAAIVVTLFTMLHGIAHRAQLDAVDAASRDGGPGRGNELVDDPTAPSATGIAGYHSIILWPEPQKNHIVPPIPAQTSLLAPGTTKPLIIKFDGPYFYFQTPNKSPSPNAVQTHGTPLTHSFQSNNFIPLVMEAHQILGTPIPIDRCREIQLSILNGDNRPGAIAIALLLTDSAHPDNQLYLGSQQVVTSLSDHFTMKAAPAAEVLSYTVPATGAAEIHRFDQITVMILPDSVNYDQGSKVAIQQFQLIPR